MGLLAATPSGAGSAGGARLDRVGSFNQPMYVHGPSGAEGLLFVVERPGVVKVLRNGADRGVFLDIRNLVSCCVSERGLLSIAFADWNTTRRFYVFFTDNQGDLRISEFKRTQANPLRAAKRTRRDLLDIRHRAYPNHNGGQLQWGPNDRLFIGTGDGGGFGDPGENAQDKSSLLGKLLRINPLRNPPGPRAYAIPRSNPYVGRNGRNEIFSRGLRNPWRFSFDRGRVLIGDVGQDRFEEVDVERIGHAAGANFGWDNFEGYAPFEDGALARHDRPIHVYSHASPCRSITGGYVVRDPDLLGLQGRYLYGDYCSGEIRSLIPRLSGAQDDSNTGLGMGFGLVSFGEDARDNVYVIIGGAVYRIAPG